MLSGSPVIAEKSEEIELGAQVLHILWNAHGIYEAISPEDRRVLEEAASRLTQVGLMGRTLSAELLEKLPVFSQLKNLQIAEPIGELTLEQIPRCFPNIEGLAFTYTHPLLPTSIQYLAPLTGLKELTFTDVGSKYPETFCVTDETCKIIGQKFPRLEQFNIVLALTRIATVTDEGISALEPLKHLKCLILSPCGISDSGLNIVAKSFPQLKVCGLTQGSLITDAGVAMLAQLQNLQALNLTDCDALTPKTLEIISAGFPHLQELTITSPLIGKEDLEIFAQQRPGLKLGK